MGLGLRVIARLLGAVATTIAVTILAFLMLRVLNPEGFGDDRSAFVALGDYLQRWLLHGDLGASTDFRQGFRPVTTLLRTGLPADLSLFAGATVLGVGAGIAGGVVCARRPRSLIDRGLLVIALLALSAPVYWVGLAAILWLGEGTGSIAEVPFIQAGTYRPLTEDPGAWLRSLVVPWCVAAAPLAGIAMRLTRATLLETADEDYVRTARGKGVRERLIARRHAVPPALPPTVALGGAYAPLLIGNLILVERIFNIPGYFSTFGRAAQEGDYPVVLGLVIAGAALVALANLLADLALAGLDPRTRA